MGGLTGIVTANLRECNKSHVRAVVDLSPPPPTFLYSFESELLTWVNPWERNGVGSVWQREKGKEREGVWCDLDEAGSLYVSRTTTRLVEEKEEDLQHHVLAIFRLCASIAAVRLRIQKEATAKSSAVLLYLFLSRSLFPRLGPAAGWLPGHTVLHTTSLSLSLQPRVSRSIRDGWNSIPPASTGQQLSRNSKQSNIGRLCWSNYWLRECIQTMHTTSVTIYVDEMGTATGMCTPTLQQQMKIKHMACSAISH